MKSIAYMNKRKISISIVGLMFLFYIALRKYALVSGRPVLSFENIKTVAGGIGLLILTVAVLTLCTTYYDRLKDRNGQGRNNKNSTGKE